MINDSQKTLYLLISLFITGIVHLLLWQAAAVVTMTSLEVNPTKSKYFEVTSVEMPIGENKRESDVVPEIEEINSKQKELFEKLLKLKSPVEPPNPILPQSLTKTLNTPMPEPIATTDTLQPSTPSTPQEILAINAGNLTKNRLDYQRRVIPKIDRSASPLSSSSSSSSSSSDRVATSTTSAPPTELPVLAAKPRIMPPSATTQQPPRPISPPAVIAVAELPPSRSPMASERNVIDSLLDVSVGVYRTSAGDDGFYKVSVATKEIRDRVIEIPKDVLFLIDSSASISYSKFREFKLGVRLALKFLRPEDRFNIVSFRDRPDPLFPGFVAATPEHIDQSIEHIEKLKTAGRTDIYAGLEPYVSRDRDDTTRPFNIFLISDGQTTSGFRFRDNELIRRVIRDNHANASIFAFSTGSKTNLFLMKFLSYNNRGFNIHESDPENSAYTLANYFAGLSQLLVTDLRFRMTEGLDHLVYPRRLPNLYRGHPLILYGRFPAGTNELTIQIIGRNREGGEEELITRIDLEEAHRAGAELAQQWALQKVLHLVSDQIRTDSTIHEQEINELMYNYNIQIPK